MGIGAVAREFFNGNKRTEAEIVGELRQARETLENLEANNGGFEGFDRANPSEAILKLKKRIEELGEEYEGFLRTQGPK